MVSAQLEQSIGRAFVNEGFRIEWYSDFDRISEEYHIPANEYEDARQYLNNIMNMYGQQEELASQQPNVVATEILKLGSEIQRYAFDVLKSSIQSSTKTFERISLMAYVLFGVGISLFTLSAVASLFQGKEVFSITFGALGTVSFVTFFIFSPSKNVQNALSNLLKAEVIFMNFWDQLHFWAPYGASKDPSRKKEGSVNLQEATKEVLNMLDKFVDKK